MSKTAKILIAVLVIAAAAVGYYAYNNYKTSKAKEAEIAALEAKIDSMVLANRSKSEIRSDAKIAAKEEKELEKLAKEESRTATTCRAEYFVNVRKVEGAITLPDNKKHYRPGTVVIKVEVNFAGQVKKATVSLKESSVKYPALHTDCKKAALSTLFESNPTQSRYTKTEGFIVYSFE